MTDSTAPLTKREPSLIVGSITALVTAALGVAVAFGLDLSKEQIAALGLLAAAVIPMVQAVITRGAVVSPATAQERRDESYELGRAEAAATVVEGRVNHAKTATEIEPDAEAEPEDAYVPKRALIEPEPEPAA